MSSTHKKETDQRPLTTLQEAFVLAYIKEPNGTQAIHASRALIHARPMDDNGASVAAARMLGNARIREAIAERRQPAVESACLSLEEKRAMIRAKLLAPDISPRDWALLSREDSMLAGHYAPRRTSAEVEVKGQVNHAHLVGILQMAQVEMRKQLGVPTLLHGPMPQDAMVEGELVSDSIISGED